jgi:hypothetical protein
MMYKAKAAVWFETLTKHSAQSESHVEFLNIKPWWYVKKPLRFKRLSHKAICHPVLSDSFGKHFLVCIIKRKIFSGCFRIGYSYT